MLSFEHLNFFFCCVPERGEENKDGAEGHAEDSDESGNFSDINDDEVRNCFSRVVLNAQSNVQP